ncbi:MAG TPA: single-stranded DNA-binding protein [Treponemataceae bacterium]|nr:single-stranded DNA-binding protein [Treponemataceae bacterium]HPS44825.1 single-stranded DNA-binding protein [Treponemataceae bacterium]
MADVNHVILIGRLTRDAELKYTSGGMAVCKFAIAVNKRRKQGEQWVDEANFFDIVLWGRSGETINQYLVKGKQVAVEGELHQNRWEQDGQSRSKIEINANNVQLLGGGAGGQGGPSSGYSGGAGSSGQSSGGSASSGGPAPYQKRQSSAASGSPDMDDSVPPDFPDDIPF